jgi:hypothetical protein
MSARNGKIARLPRSIRHQLNLRLDQSEPSPELLAWLNALPEVKEIVQKEFGGAPLSKQNLYQWRKGGFEEWLARHTLAEDARDVSELAEKVNNPETTGVLADDAAMVLAARFGVLIAHWNGEVDPRFEAKARVLTRLSRSVVELQRAMHRSQQERFEMRQKLEEREKAEKEERKKKLLSPWFDALKIPLVAAQFGGGEQGRKVAKYILAVQSDRLDPEDEVWPGTRIHEYDEPSPVKPARKSKKAKRTRKTKTAKAGKPLEESKIAAESAETSHEAPLNPVTPGNATVQDSPVSNISPIAPSLRRKISEKNACEKFHDEAISCLFHRDSGCRFGEGVFLQLVTLSDATD